MADLVKPSVHPDLVKPSTYPEVPTSVAVKATDTGVIVETQPLPSAASETTAALIKRTVNLRDVGAIWDHLKRGCLFRSSQLISAPEIRALGIKSILDLRIMTTECKTEANSKKNLLEKLALAPAAVVEPVVGAANALVGKNREAQACSVCRANHEKLELDSSVYHVDLMESKVKLSVFAAVPFSTKLRTVLAPLCCRSMESVMAPAVADPNMFGYRQLYRMLLDRAPKSIAKALRLFSDADQYPFLVHCIHGKDRTGLIIMLLLLICGAEPQSIADDYAQSEVLLKESRARSELALDSYLIGDQVIEANSQVMLDTLDYLASKYGDIRGYCKYIGLQDSEVSAIRINLMERAQASDLLEKMRTLSRPASQARPYLFRPSSLPSSRPSSPPPSPRPSEMPSTPRNSDKTNDPTAEARASYSVV